MIGKRILMQESGSVSHSHGQLWLHCN